MGHAQEEGVVIEQHRSGGDGLVRADGRAAPVHAQARQLDGRGHVIVAARYLPVLDVDLCDVEISGVIKWWAQGDKFLTFLKVFQHNRAQPQADK